MGAWVPPGAPPVMEVQWLPKDTSDISLDAMLVARLEANLERRKVEASNAAAPLPIGACTTAFRAASRMGSTRTATGVPLQDEEMEEGDVEGDDEMASDEMSDGEFGAHIGDSPVGGMQSVEDDDDDDISDSDDDLAGYL